MAKELGWGLDVPFKAAVDLSSYQYYLMKAGSVAGEVTFNATVNGSCLGVLQNDPTAGEEAAVRVFGFSKVRATTEASASLIYWGGMLKSSSTGMVAGYDGTTASLFGVGIALETIASGSGQYIDALILPPAHAKG